MLIHEQPMLSANSIASLMKVKLCVIFPCSEIKTFWELSNKARYKFSFKKTINIYKLICLLALVFFFLRWSLWIFLKFTISSQLMLCFMVRAYAGVSVCISVLGKQTRIVKIVINSLYWKHLQWDLRQRKRSHSIRAKLFK